MSPSITPGDTSPSSSDNVPDALCRARSIWIKDRKSTRLNSSHLVISYAVFCLKKKNPFRRGSHGAYPPAAPFWLRLRVGESTMAPDDIVRAQLRQPSTEQADGPAAASTHTSHR